MIMNICICYCVDDNELSNKLLYCSLYSLRRYNSIKVIIMTFETNIYVNHFHKFDNIEIKYIDEIYNKKYKMIKNSYYLNNDKKEVEFRKDISNMCYFRLEIPILLKEYDMVLYLDTDTEIKKSLDPIFHLDFENAEIIGQYNREPHLEEALLILNDNNIHSFDKILSNKEDYICSGIILFNNKNINNTNYEDRLQSLLDFEYEYYHIHLWKDEFLINIGFNCKSSMLLECDNEDEYKTTKNLETNSYIVHYIWNYKKNLIEKYRLILEKEKLI